MMPAVGSGVPAAGTSGSTDGARPDDLWARGSSGFLIDRESFRRRCRAIFDRSMRCKHLPIRCEPSGDGDLLPEIADLKRKAWAIIQAGRPVVRQTDEALGPNLGGSDSLLKQMVILTEATPKQEMDSVSSWNELPRLGDELSGVEPKGDELQAKIPVHPEKQLTELWEDSAMQICSQVEDTYNHMKVIIMGLVGQGCPAVRFWSHSAQRKDTRCRLAVPDQKDCFRRLAFDPGGLVAGGVVSVVIAKVVQPRWDYTLQGHCQQGLQLFTTQVKECITQRVQEPGKKRLKNYTSTRKPPNTESSAALFEGDRHSQ